MTSILRKITTYTILSVALVMAWSQNAQATIWLPLAQAASPEVPEGGNGLPESLGSSYSYYENLKMYTGERISLDFQNADLHNIIRIIGEVSGKNIVVSDKVTGKITLKLKDVPWDQALDIVLSTRNLGVEDAGDVLTIYDLTTLNNIQTGRQRLLAEKALAATQLPLVKKVFTPKYSPISAVATELTKLKSNRGKIASIGNDIYVEDDPGTVATMTQVFMKIDKATRQILIEARIIEATSGFINRLGVTWGAEYNSGGVGDTDGGGAAGSGSIDINDTGVALGFGFLNKANTLLLNARLTASEASSDSRTISAPRIMAANDQEVSIKQGQQIAYSTDATSSTPANIQFKDVVLELTVKPHIEENGQLITLDIEVTNDSLGAGTGNDRPIHTRAAETILMVRDGETVVIGGIIVDTQLSAATKVPVVHRIPLFGWLFQNRNIENAKSEMLIFITANIIPMTI